MPTGKLCQSPVLKGERFCYYHHQAHARAARRFRNSRLCEAISLAEFEGLGPMQDIMLAIARKGISPKMSRLVHFALQIPAVDDAKTSQ